MNWKKSRQKKWDRVEIDGFHGCFAVWWGSILQPAKSTSFVQGIQDWPYTESVHPVTHGFHGGFNNLYCCKLRVWSNAWMCTVYPPLQRGVVNKFATQLCLCLWCTYGIPPCYLGPMFAHSRSAPVSEKGPLKLAAKRHLSWERSAKDEKDMKCEFISKFIFTWFQISHSYSFTVHSHDIKFIF